MADYCRKHLIRQRYSDPYTPQQNGLAERFNRTILEALRTNLFDSKLRRNLWNEVLAANVLTLNQIPTHKSKKSPYELFKGVSIPLSYFHPIGNPVAVLPHKTKSKLAPRGEFGRLIGFNPGLKSYKILLDDGKMADCKHVEFLDYRQDCSQQYDNSDDLIIAERVEEDRRPHNLEKSPEVSVKEEEDDEINQEEFSANRRESEEEDNI
ncbi:hypothetical protein VP01_3307g3 [Puccinia sorghi]|uniref:Integrase catalytic domain-containing protein n=1 Tax=Puccinia sorghi TaxID=27349 RepID=A0A0L6UXB9_9BASI|nr:hypothetical protein VP01_3307g3 [Puccinia sorghi]